MHTIDLDRTESALEVQGSKFVRCGDPEATSCVNTNLALDQGKPRCIKPPSLWFVYLHILFMILDCALGCRSWIDTLVALRLLSDLSLLTLWLELGR
jgi:hypothetical protein